MSNLKPTTLETLRSAEENLKRVKSIAPQERVKAFQNAGHHGAAEWHPCEDHANLIIAEAELQLAEAVEAYASTEPEGIQLCAALDAALVHARDALAAIKDDPEPTLASTPEAKAEYEERLAKHADALKANQSSRTSIVSSAAARIAKAAQASPKMLDDVSAAVADAKTKLAGVVDPEAPVLGDASPVTVSALSRALAAHHTHVEANAKKREAVHADLVPVLTAIQTGYLALAKKRGAQNLPSPPPFHGTIAGERVSLGGLIWAAEAADLTPQRCDEYRRCFGVSPRGTERPKAALRAIADRRKAWDARQIQKEKERERNNSIYFGKNPEGKDVFVPRYPSGGSGK